MLETGFFFLLTALLPGALAVAAHSAAAQHKCFSLTSKERSYSVKVRGEYAYIAVFLSAPFFPFTGLCVEVT